MSSSDVLPVIIRRWLLVVVTVTVVVAGLSWGCRCARGSHPGSGAAVVVAGQVHAEAAALPGRESADMLGGAAACVHEGSHRGAEAPAQAFSAVTAAEDDTGGLSPPAGVASRLVTVTLERPSLLLLLCVSRV